MDNENLIVLVCPTQLCIHTLQCLYDQHYMNISKINCSRSYEKLQFFYAHCANTEHKIFTPCMC